MTRYVTDRADWATTWQLASRMTDSRPGTKESLAPYPGWRAAIEATPALAWVDTGVRFRQGLLEESPHAANDQPGGRIAGAPSPALPDVPVGEAACRIHGRAGADFEAFDGALRGRILQIVPDRLIVQSWRSTAWAVRDLDSTLVLTFWPQGRNGRIELTHVNVADSDFAGVSEGWNKYYWGPWRAYLEQKRRGRRGEH